MQIKRLFCFICLFLKFQTHTHQWLELTSVRVQRQRRQWHPTPVLLPGKSHGRRSLVGCSPWGHEESDMTEQLPFHFSLSCLGKEMATHSSVLVWRIPGTEEPGRLPSMESHRVRHDWSDLAAAAAAAAAAEFKGTIASAQKVLHGFSAWPCHQDALLCWDISEFPPTSSLAVSWPH